MEMDSRPVVEVSEADIYQENQKVLSDISFKIEKGEFVYLIGRTGSGKSSLLKTLYADLSFDKGSIDVAGFDIRKIKSKKVPYLRRKIGIIFQDFQLFPDRTVSENLLFVMKATGWKDKTKMKGRLAEVLMRVGLGAAAGKMPHQLSGGEQQRVVIARALINEPVILFADEPTGNLDPEVSKSIFKLFEEINRSGTAILMATHNHNFITENPGRVLKCEEGKLLDSTQDEFNLATHY
ncbi:ATP-binding cassette domain-containing protein [Reichenbachiella agarivorans]|uniref:ATP-binding cassette domain-containing protein n=1 Tax=Reichenbachiella agarivorans TaxID=2979464 RepID=A0ABY6CSV2_9BACT|nr:ATP-binding cassette domain-containing protein [Reichenbachiella agarivorans]UXP32458.1 ATP-binding cassette domain-containing protein [Reichenbachiella agarivorans]